MDRMESFAYHTITISRTMDEYRMLPKMHTN